MQQQYVSITIGLLTVSTSI